MSTVMRPWRKEDLGSLVENANNRAVWLNMRDLFPYPYREEDGRRWLEYATGLDPATHFAIQYDGVAVGGVGVMPGKDVERISGEVGYWVGEAYRGKGLATAAVRELTAYAFTVLQLRRVFAVPFARNTASARVLEKAEFRREGLLVDSAVKNGQVESQAVYAFTRPEWERLLAATAKGVGPYGRRGKARNRSRRAAAPLPHRSPSRYSQNEGRTMITLEPVGHVRCARKDLSDDGWGSVATRIELDQAFAPECLDGLEEFSHVEVIFHFHRVAESAIERGSRRPRGNPAWPRVGIFAQRGKDRPNRIGTTIVEITGREGRVLTVRGLDAVDGTPVLDIKPVMAEFLPRTPVRQPRWSQELMRDYWNRTAE